MLGDFFDQINSSTFDDTDYIFDKVTPPHGLHVNRQFGWGGSLQSSLHGTSSLLSHASHLPGNLQDSRHGRFAVSPSYPPSNLSQDVLAAATLLQGNHTQLALSPETPAFPPRHPPHNSLDYSPHGHFATPFRRQSSQPFTTHNGSDSRPSQVSLHHRASVDQATSAYYHDVAFPGARRTNSGPVAGMDHALMKSIDVRWGSDVSFLDHGYIAPAGQTTEEKVTSDMIHTMDGLIHSASGPSTRAPSPKAFTRQKVVRRQLIEDGRAKREDELRDPRGAHAHRKRKNTNDAADEEEDDSESAGQLKRRKRIVLNGRPVSQTVKAAAEDQDDRERSVSDGQKPGRENLTEEQKRSNHILSEQKRRNLIKQGFDDLCDLVPDLTAGGYSKSAMLVQAADWLEDMLKGNEELRSMIASFNEAGG